MTLPGILAQTLQCPESVEKCLQNFPFSHSRNYLYMYISIHWYEYTRKTRIWEPHAKSSSDAPWPGANIAMSSVVGEVSAKLLFSAPGCPVCLTRLPRVTLPGSFIGLLHRRLCTHHKPHSAKLSLCTYVYIGKKIRQKSIYEVKTHLTTGASSIDVLYICRNSIVTEMMHKKYWRNARLDVFFLPI